MPDTKTVGIIAAVIIIIVVVGVVVAWQSGAFNPAATPEPTATPTPTPTATPTPEPSPTPEDSMQQDVRNAVMTYIEDSHNETAQYMESFNWTGGRETGGGIGAETYTYCSGDWAVQLKYPVVLDPIYTVNANYTAENVTVIWMGTYQNGNINETSYTNSALTMPEQVRNDIVNFLRANHTETMPLLQDLAWTGGDITPEGLVGAVTYSYQSIGWNVTMTYPVVPDPLYTITALYAAPETPTQIMVSWEGTWQNCVINETSYTYTP